MTREFLRDRITLAITRLWNNMKEYTYFVYILFSERNGTLYVGVTNDISYRMNQHKTKINSESFSAKYKTDKLGYLEIYGDVHMAIAREKQIKAGSRADKIKLIEKMNPYWHDLANELMNLFMGLKMSWETK